MHRLPCVGLDALAEEYIQNKRCVLQLLQSWDNQVALLKSACGNAYSLTLDNDDNAHGK